MSRKAGSCLRELEGFRRSSNRLASHAFWVLAAVSESASLSFNDLGESRFTVRGSRGPLEHWFVVRIKQSKPGVTPGLG